MRIRLLLAMIFAALAAHAQLVRFVVPQIADGAGWSTEILIVNQSTTLESPIDVKFYNQDGGAMALPLVGRGEVTKLDERIPPGGSLRLETQGLAHDVTSGWAFVTSGVATVELPGGQQPTASPASVATSFLFQTSGRSDYEAAVFAINADSTRVTMPFENTGGYISSYALVNATGLPQTYEAAFTEDNGVRFLAGNITLPAWGQMAFSSTERFPLSNNRRGVVTFRATTAAGRLGAIGLRFNPTGPFTTLPPVERQ